MAKGIRLSEKHGVNPSMEVCFWCGEVKGIALFGKMKGDVEAPRHVVLNYEPCDKCKEGMNSGFTIMEATERNNGNPEIQKGVYPTGRWSVLKTEAAERIFGEEVAHGGKCFMAVETYTNLIKE